MPTEGRLDEPLSVAETARAIGVSVDTVKRSIPPAELPFHRTPGGHRRYQRSDVEAYIARRRVEA